MYEIGSVTWNQLNEDWFQKIIISNTGQLLYSYHYKIKKSKSCVVFEIDTKLARQFCSYALIEKDLRDTLSFLVELNKIIKFKESKEKGILMKALCRAVVITYGKCFTEATGRKIKLEENTISHENKQLHLDIMNMRHEYVAHAGSSEHELCKRIYVLAPEKKYLKKKVTYSLQVSELRQTIIPLSFPETCKPLIEEMHSKVQRKISALTEKVEIRNIPPEGFYKIARKSNVDRIILNEKDLENIAMFKST